MKAQLFTLCLIACVLSTTTRKQPTFTKHTKRNAAMFTKYNQGGNIVQCDGAESYCDGEGDCTGTNWCECQEAQDLCNNNGGGQQMETIQCPGAESYCDGQGDCQNKPEWCECDKAQNLCQKNAGSTTNDTTNDHDESGNSTQDGGPNDQPCGDVCEGFFSDMENWDWSYCDACWEEEPCMQECDCGMDDRECEDNCQHCWMNEPCKGECMGPMPQGDCLFCLDPCGRDCEEYYMDSQWFNYMQADHDCNNCWEETQNECNDRCSCFENACDYGCNFDCAQCEQECKDCNDPGQCDQQRRWCEDDNSERMKKKLMKIQMPNRNLLTKMKEECHDDDTRRDGKGEQRDCMMEAEQCWKETNRCAGECWRPEPSDQCMQCWDNQWN